jgi:hypothetical protein
MEFLKSIKKRVSPLFPRGKVSGLSERGKVSILFKRGKGFF